MAHGWKLTGRGEELRFIDAATRRAGLVLAGDAGVGKTRLAREALALAARRGVATRWAGATVSARMLPFGAFLPVLGAVGDDPAQVLRRASEALVAAPGRRGTLVAVDDAHLLDELSATLLHQLVLQAKATVVITVRSGEPAPDAVTALWKDGHLERLEVQPLSEPETATLLESALGGPVDSVSSERMWRLTRGNALYLRQLVDGEIEGGRLAQVGGLWRWTGTPMLSPGLTELVANRMGTLPGPVRDVVDLLALGEPLGVSLLGRLTDAEAVEQAEGRGLLGVERDGRRLDARLAHPLYGEVRRGDLGELRARRLRGRIATALAEAGSRRVDDPLRRAVLAVESDLAPDPRLLTEAAEGAARLIDLPLAQRLGQAAVQAGGGFRAQAVVAMAATFVGRPEDVDAELIKLTELAGTDAELAKATASRAMFLAWLVADVEKAEALLRDASERIADPDDRILLTALQAKLDGDGSRPGRAAEAALAILSDGDLADEAVVLACCALVVALATTGRADAMSPHVARGVEAAGRSPEFAVFRNALLPLQVNGLRLAGYLDDAATLAASCNEAGKDLAMGAEIGGMLLGYTELARGRLQHALRWLRQARAGIEPYGDSGGWRYAILVALPRAFAATGDVDAARQALADLRRHRHPAMAFLDSEMILANAWVVAAEGAVTEAIKLASDAARLAADRGQLALEVLALQAAVCFGDRTSAGRLAELATLVDGPRAPAAAAHAAALAADDPDALRAAAEQLEAMGDLLSAADAAAQAAVTYTRHGKTGSAHAAGAHAHRLAEACEGARTPALLAAGRPLPLTEREREIVTLAAHGLSNKDIADRLTVSIRTVEGHLYRAGAKLGTTRRTDLATHVQID